MNRVQDRRDRLERTRYRISLGVKGSWDPRTQTHRRFHWPVLYRTAAEAWAMIDTGRPFLPVKGYGRVKSATVDTVLLPKRAPAWSPPRTIGSGWSDDPVQRQQEIAAQERLVGRIALIAERIGDNELDEGRGH